MRLCVSGREGGDATSNPLGVFEVATICEMNCSVAPPGLVLLAGLDTRGLRPGLNSVAPSELARSGSFGEWSIVPVRRSIWRTNPPTRVGRGGPVCSGDGMGLESIVYSAAERR